MVKKHFVPIKDWDAGGGTGDIGGIPVCKGFKKGYPAWKGFGEIAKTRRGVTCGNCRRTRVFRKLR